ncbi:hypothetical protein PV390_18905 [Streptomyces sp. ME02-6991-2A]|uniref:hypothetical protein n=1 Tax=Streptomyces sp. ME02-6991-2A TaxID=3028677 RepID=UPI0029BB0081|nr:hypothetical protein [Streptomyces sp. ME02-6991-2A]MDX3376470.1 hypothetical protein [Streptomyces sp. ME02-6991-2A]
MLVIDASSMIGSYTERFTVPSGEASVEDAILHAAVNGWYEGHIQGEDECPGCIFRGQLPRNGSGS